MNIESKQLASFIAVTVFALLGGVEPSRAATRLKDMATVKGVRDNILIGYGIVVGLKGTGDSSTDVTAKSLGRLFGKLGLDVENNAQVKSKNAAAVIVTAKLPPFARVGSKIDVTVSSIGDASSLEGGTLLVTPLRAGDQNVYAVAQGMMTLGGLTDGTSVFPTVGRVVSGATIEKDIEVDFASKKSFRLALHNPDFTTAARVVALVDAELGGKFANARDSGTVDIIIPFHFEADPVRLMALIENIQVNLDQRAKVVINERTGTVVMGNHVGLSPVAISHGELSIEVAQAADPGKAPAAAGAKVSTKPQRLVEMGGGANVSDLVKALNALGVQPKDLTAIFQTLKKLGALQAELEIL